MKDILWLIQKTLSVLLKNKKSLFIIISLPIIGTLISFSIYGNAGQGSLNIGIINKEKRADSKRYDKVFRRIKSCECE